MNDQATKPSPFETRWTEVVSQNDLMQLHCLACGKPIVSPGWGLAEVLCEHVTFVIDFIGELAHVRADVADGVQAIFGRSDDLEYDELRSGLLKAVPAESVVFEYVKPDLGPFAGYGLVVGMDLVREE